MSLASGARDPVDPTAKFYASFEEGDTLGEYTLMNILGEGATGVVWLAVDMNERLVAIKICLKTEENMHLISREVGLLGRLNHEHIVKLYNIIEDDKMLCLVMEVCEGGELLDYVVLHQKLEEKQAKRLFVQLMSAVQYMHSCKIVNRDLKMENILLTADFNIKIIDFSIGAFLGGQNETKKTFCGSPDYAAPEIWMNKEYAGPEVDVWSLGIVLYGMVVGELPFADVKHILTGNFTVPPHVSESCTDLINRLLVIEPEHRATVDEILSHPWLHGINDLDKELMDKLGRKWVRRSSTSSDGSKKLVSSNRGSVGSFCSSTYTPSVSSDPASNTTRKWKINVQLPNGRKMRVPIDPTSTLADLADDVKARCKATCNVQLMLDEDTILGLEDVVEDALEEGESVIAVVNTVFGLENIFEDSPKEEQSTVPMPNKPTHLKKGGASKSTFAFEGMRICVVDDDPFTQAIVETMLGITLRNPKIVLHGDGKSAFEDCQKNKYDLIIMDCNMPVMDGYEATLKIRGEQCNRDTVIIGLSANSFEEDRNKCMEVGMDEYLRKPLWQSDLQKKLEEFMDRIVSTK